MKTNERIERLENVVCEIREVLRFLAGDDTWQSVWDKLDEIAKEINEERNDTGEE